MAKLRTYTLLAGALLAGGAAVAGGGMTAEPSPSGGPSALGRQAACASPQDDAKDAAVSAGRSQARDDERARGLVRIGEDGIARENDAALDAYFAKDFVFHGPGGDMSYDELKAAFASMRAAFSDFAVTRPVIIVKGDYVSARTTMTGVFTGPFPAPPFGTLAPTGKPIKRELINVFRYDAEGRLAEEWVQYDNLGFLRQLGVDLQPTANR